MAKHAGEAGGQQKATGVQLPMMSSNANAAAAEGVKTAD